MSDTPPPSTVETIRQAFSYVNRFSNRLFVINIADSLISHDLFPLFIRDVVLLHRMGIRIALVPGARSRIDQVLQTFNVAWTANQGIRITPPEAMQYVKMAASDVANRILTLLAENSANGVVGNWVRARSIGVRDGIDYRSSGLVESVQTDIVARTVSDGLIPIFPNVGWSTKGTPYNISSARLALTLARELQAAKLFFATDTDAIDTGRFVAPPGAEVSEDGVISGMTVEQARAFIGANGGDQYNRELELVSLAVEACIGGVERVHIVDGRREGALLWEIFSNRGIGTMVYANRHASVRAMTVGDIPEVLRIMQPSVQEQSLVYRSAEQLEAELADFVVYDVDGTLHGCAALHTLDPVSGEIAALAVDPAYAGLGTGRKLVSYLLDYAQSRHMKAVYVLTTQAADWFYQLGFRDSSVDELPRARRKRYDAQRRSRVLLYEVPPRSSSSRLQVE